MGIQFQYGNVTIIPDLPGGNAVSVDIDSGQYVVTLNGKSQSFGLEQIGSITYIGNQGGGNVVGIRAPLVCLLYLYGGKNAITGGHLYNYVYMHGNNNAYGGSGVWSTVWQYGGQDNVITWSGGLKVYP